MSPSNRHSVGLELMAWIMSTKTSFTPMSFCDDLTELFQELDVVKTSHVMRQMRSFPLAQASL